MAAFIFFVISILFFALPTLCFIVALVNVSSRRTEAIKAIAPQLGVEFLGNETLYFFRNPTLEGSILPKEVRHFPLFSRGKSLQALNIVRGQIGSATFYLFDYCCRMSGGKKSNTYMLTVALIQSENFHLPKFHLQPDNFLQRKILDMLDIRHIDIDFDYEPEFSDNYLLIGSDKERIRQTFNHRVISFYNNQPKVCTEGLDNMLLYYGWQQLPVKEWPNFLAQAKEAARVFSTSSHYV